MYNGKKVIDVHAHMSAPPHFRGYAMTLVAIRTPQEQSLSIPEAAMQQVLEKHLAAMDELGGKPNLRVVVLKGNGKHFQAGADLKWINAVRPQSAEANEAASRATFDAVQRLNTLPVPTVALVQGGCFGGGTGVIAACDVVIAADNALFSITEVRWG